MLLLEQHAAAALLAERVERSQLSVSLSSGPIDDSVTGAYAALVHYLVEVGGWYAFCAHAPYSAAYALFADS